MSYTKKFIDLYRANKVDDTTMIKMAVFTEELKSLVKESGSTETFMDYLKSLATSPGAKAAGTIALLGTALGAGEELAERALGKMDERRNDETSKLVFEELKNDPTFQKYDPEVIRKNFDAIQHFAPHITQNAIAAKAYLANMVQWADSDLGVPIPNFSEMAKTQDSIAKSRGNQGTDIISRLFDPVSQAIHSGIKGGWADN